MSGISSFFGLTIALRGLEAQQSALDITAHNVANLNTRGYTRQAAELVAALGVDVPAGMAGGGGAMLGGGVTVQAYQRARDAFTDVQWRVQSTATAYADTTAQALSDAQVSLQEPSDSGIAELMNKFWGAWSDLSNSPESAGARQAVEQAGQAVVDAVKALDASISRVQSNAADQYSQLIGPSGDVQTLAKQIVDLNAQIDKETIAGRQPNDLLDARDKAIDALSQLGQVTVTNLPNGGVQVAFGGVTTPPLVDDTTTDATGLATMTAPGGELGALKDLADPAGKLAGYRTALNGFVNQLVRGVNGAYGGAFFTGTDVAGFGMDPAIAANPATIRTSASGAAGANDIATAIAGLKGGAADKDYSDFVLDLGTDVSQAASTDDTAQAVLGSISDKRDSISGVALDEEVTNMLQFQRAYQSASRVMSTMDSMLDTLINHTGQVGL
jgi:flagellar hook-associated protein 1